MENPFTCVSAPERDNNECEITENARLRNAFYWEKGSELDTTTPALLQSSLLALELSGKAYVIRNINGTYNGSEAKTGKGRGDEPDRITGRGHQAEFTDFAAAQNVPFWNRMQVMSKYYNFGFVTATKAWLVEDSNVKVDPKLPITDDVEAEIEGTITNSWSQKEIPTPVDMETNLLGKIPKLTVVGVSTVAPGAQTIVAAAGAVPATATVATGANVKFKVDITAAVKWALKPGSVLPAGLTLDSVTGIISGVAGAATDATFVVVGKGLTGIKNEVAVRYIVTA